MEVKKVERKYKSYDIVYCHSPIIAKEIFDIYKNKGYQVMISNQEVTTGTHGNQGMKRIDIMEELSKEEYKEDAIQEIILEKELDEMLINRKE